MDRFIVSIWDNVKNIPSNLKSNMDRFIGNKAKSNCIRSDNLKSNMDRFIVLRDRDGTKIYMYLKSNMDRFIDTLFY